MSDLDKPLTLGISKQITDPAQAAAQIVGAPAREAVRICWGPKCEIVGSECLTQRLSPVVRLTLRGGDAPQSVILKQMWPAQMAAGSPVAANPFFIAECIVGQFLSEIGAEGGLKPMLYAADARGVILMEDLGPINYPTMPSYAVLRDPLARAMARLHARSRPHLHRFRELITQSGLAGPGADRRDCLQVIQQDEARHAIDYLVASAGVDGLDAQALRAELEGATALIAAPGPFETLIHDDVAHGRQTFLRGDQLLLIDFEHGQIGHALVDLARVLLGKMEAEVTTAERRQIWISANFPLDLVGRYRSTLAEEFDIVFDEATWRRHLAAAMIFGALQVIGYASRRAARNRAIVGSLRQNVNGLLYRLGTLLNGWAEYPALNAFILRFLCIPSLDWVTRSTHATRRTLPGQVAKPAHANMDERAVA